MQDDVIATPRTPPRGLDRISGLMESKSEIR
jgi:hypothetical protein